MYYLITGFALAALRIGLLARSGRHPEEFADWIILLVVYPEELLYRFTGIGPTGLLRRTALYVAGSYLIATPLLAAGWLLRRPRLGRQVAVSYLTCGGLALARISLFAWLNDLTTGDRSMPWVLYPEALLLVHTRLGALNWYDYSFVFAVLLTVGSFVMATPILLERGLWLKHR